MLTAVLGYDHPGAVVQAFDTTDKTSGASTRWKPTVGYNEIGQVADLPEQLFAKTDFAQRLTRDLAGLLHGEPDFCKQLRPNPKIKHRAASTALSTAGRGARSPDSRTSSWTASFCTSATPDRERICLAIIERTVTAVVDLDAAG